MTIEQKEQENNYWLKERYTNLQLSRLGLLYYLYLTYAIKFDMKFQIDMLWQRTEETGKLNYTQNFIEWIKKCKDREIIIPPLSSLGIQSSILNIYKKLSVKCKDQKVQTYEEQQTTISLVRQVFNNSA